MMVSQLALVYGAYLLATASPGPSNMAIMGVAMLVAGFISSRIGAKRTLIAGLTLIIVFSALAGMSDSIGAIVGFRAGWGLGNALFISTALAAIAVITDSPVLVVGAVLNAVGFGGYAWLVAHYGPTVAPWQMIAPLAVTGFGFGLVVAPMVDAVLTGVIALGLLIYSFRRFRGSPYVPYDVERPSPTGGDTATERENSPAGSATGRS